MAEPAAIARRALGMLDLTSLNENDDAAGIDRLCARALTPEGPVAAVCVHARFAARCRSRLAGSGVRVAAVANFPHGNPDAASAAAEVRSAVAEGAEEVDLVLPYAAWAAGEHGLVADFLAACRAAAEDVSLKAILETGRLAPEDIAGLCRAAILGGSDFLKTSTGKVEVSATLAAARIMLQAIGEAGCKVGFKAAGGIRTTADAGAYLALADEILGAGWAVPATFRFGASGLLDDILAVAAGATPLPRRVEGY